MQVPSAQERLDYLHGQDVIAAHTLQDLGHVVEADAHAQVAVAAKVLKPVGAQLQRIRVSVQQKPTHAGLHSACQYPSRMRNMVCDSQRCRCQDVSGIGSMPVTRM